MSGKKSASYGPQNQSTLVAGKKRVRSTSVCVWLSPDEQAKIRERMADVGIRNLSAYMRKMALNGYVLHVDLAPVRPPGNTGRPALRFHCHRQTMRR